MLRNYLIAALRNLAHNKLHAGISIFGLAIGICAALLMSLIFRNQLTYDTFIPGYRRTYLAVMKVTRPGHPPVYRFCPQCPVVVDSDFAGQAKLSFPQIEAATRITGQSATLRHGQIDASQWFYWADPNVFDVLPFPTVAGDLKTALARPDGIVITRSIAQKLFGRADPIGQTLHIITRNGARPNPDPTKPPIMVPSAMYPMTVTAVIDDLPDNDTQFESGVFGSIRAPFSAFNLYQAPSQHPFVTTYMRLAPGASIDQLRAAMPGFMRSYFNPKEVGGVLTNATVAPYEFIRLDRVHVDPRLNPGVEGLLAMTALIAGLILLIACVNFVNLSTARSARRAREVGIRKASGARRRALIVQFLGESLLYVLIATAVAFILTLIALPYVNSALDVGAVFDYWRHPLLLVGLGSAVVLLAVLAGLYPAFVLSASKPAKTLKSQLTASHKSNLLRQVLVTGQFAALIALAIASIVVYRQQEFATREALRMDTDQVVYIGDMPPNQTCDGALMTGWGALPGVRTAACGDPPFSFASGGLGSQPVTFRDGTAVNLRVANVKAGLLRFYGIGAVAGRLFKSRDPCAAVINEAAVHSLGYATPAAAIGQTLNVQKPSICKGIALQIIGVAPDVSLDSVQHPTDPTIYVNEVDDPNSVHAHLRLSARDIPETLAAIDRVWRASGTTEPIGPMFLNSFVEARYRFVLREAQEFAVFSGIALLLACLGLVALAISTAERRTKEIGIRKVMGANRFDVLRLLAWEFVKPVLWANVIAWPVAYFAMNRWLSTFIRHINLDPLIFLIASAVALLVALATVSGKALLVARTKPVAALRYE